ncbi:hypothetical protein [Clostridium sporogenes]|uniref:hypothetical protein n=1 Tax=Clostridium sporogenes TaxID=1509 RepID=UPI000A465BD8|nr:hypothetical protein [Clostridium sporogenes]
MALKINTSFKENDEEMKLYLQVISNSDKSAFIKEALKFYIKYRHMLPTLEQKSIKNKA